MKPARFKRLGRATVDEPGRVIVRIVRSDGTRYAPKKGNVVRVIAIADARVSEVASAIERALFDEE